MLDLIARQSGGLSSSPPARHTRSQNHPTLLVSWFLTGCALVIILLRVGGRYFRTERLFREDKIAFASIVPLLVRMGVMHTVLLYGTNNITTQGLTPQDISERVTGSKLVLAGRIFYAMYIWMAKWTISEFLKRLTATSWNRHYELILRTIRVFLILTFIGVVIATLAECQPFDHYWQVIPDPGPSCRTDYAQVLVMGISDGLTDLALILFPIPIILTSGFAIKRKISLTLLFMTSGLLIPITVVRMILIFNAGGRQQVRSLWASIEIVAAAAVSNGVILGSFVRDRGVKKVRRYRADPTASVHSERPSINRRMTTQHWGNDSDHDLFRAIGGRLSSVVVEVDEENAAQGRAPGQVYPNMHEILDEKAILNEKDSQGFESSISAGTSSQASNAMLLDGMAKEEGERIQEDIHLPPARSANNAALAEFFRQGPPVGPHGAQATTVQDFAPRPLLHIDPFAGRRGSGLSLNDAGGLLPITERRGSSVSFADQDGDRSTHPQTPSMAYHRPSVSSSAGTGISPTTRRRQSRLPSIIDTEAIGRALGSPPRRGPDDSVPSLVDAGGLLGVPETSPHPELSEKKSGIITTPRRISSSANTRGRQGSDYSLSPQPSPRNFGPLHLVSDQVQGRRSLSRGAGSPRPSGGWARRFNFSSPSPPPTSGRGRRPSEVRTVSGPGAGQGFDDMEMADAGGLLG